MKPLTGQKLKILKALETGDWFPGTYFLHTLKISQFHTRIHEL
jgi:hypothetical protein